MYSIICTANIPYLGSILVNQCFDWWGSELKAGVLGAETSEYSLEYFGSGVSGSCGAEVDKHMKNGEDVLRSEVRKFRALLKLDN